MQLDDLLDALGEMPEVVAVDLSVVDAVDEPARPNERVGDDAIRPLSEDERNRLAIVKERLAERRGTRGPGLGR
ncbi:hypothetical protein DVB87_19585 [Tsukamurella tyrosinosolvens]|nr:hypothetical protein DVB87_19585 [Tsukamurella tyrosinosolvens]